MAEQAQLKNKLKQEDWAEEFSQKRAQRDRDGKYERKIKKHGNRSRSSTIHVIGILERENKAYRLPDGIKENNFSELKLLMSIQVKDTLSAEQHGWKTPDSLPHQTANTSRAKQNRLFCKQIRIILTSDF